MDVAASEEAVRSGRQAGPTPGRPGLGVGFASGKDGDVAAAGTAERPETQDKPETTRRRQPDGKQETDSRGKRHALEKDVQIRHHLEQTLLDDAHLVLTCAPYTGKTNK